MAVDGKSFVEKQTKRLLLLAILFLFVQAMAKSCGAAVSGSAEGKDSIGRYLLRSLAGGVEAVLYDQFMPGIAFTAGDRHGTHWLLQEQIDCLIPFYGFLTRGMKTEEGDTADFRSIMLAEAEEGSSLAEEDERSGSGGESVEPQGEALAELLRAENEAALQTRQSPIFIPHARQTRIELEALENYETLIQQFYTIDANTVAGSDQLNVRKFMETDMSISKEGEGPQILIYHTHSQEAFLDSAPGESADTIQGVGEYLASLLRDTYGYNVLHHTGQYDIDSRDDSYSRALTDLERILKENPSIQVVIDLHRDAMPETTRLVMDLDGRPTARFMFFNGLSRTKKTGDITYLYNENLDGNLAFSFQMQRKAMEYYPGLTRKIYLKGYRYNMHLRPRSLLIELGAQNNTVEEAMNACEPLAHLLDMVLSGE